MRLKTDGDLMDPITHGVIGLAISSFSGEAVSLTNPLTVGCAIGAISPDIDAITRIFYDDFVYLKHHRGATHSMQVIVLFAAVITGILYLFYPMMSVTKVFIWTFLGGISHTLFDILNSYGAQLFLKKKKASLLTLYDPVISVLSLILIFNKKLNFLGYLSILMTFGCYLLSRMYLKGKARNIILKKYKSSYKVNDIEVLPSLMAFWKWDFILAANSHHIVGKYNQWTHQFEVVKKFKKRKPEAVEHFNKTNVGKYFNRFSPNLHIQHYEKDNQIILFAVDMRYYMKKQFMHHATVVFDQEYNVLESHFHPYSLNKWISVAER